MKPEQLAALIGYRLEQANETLQEAKILLDESALRGAVNRTYYAMFYAVLALLATRRIGTSKHSAIISAFDREFVKPGVFERALSRSLHLAFDRRQTHDYGELVQIDRQTTEEMLADARQFVSQIEAYLHASESSRVSAEE